VRPLQSSGELNSPTMTVGAAADYIGISRTTAYSEAQRYRDSGGAAGLLNIKLGGRVLVLTTLLNELLRAGDHFADTEIGMRSTPSACAGVHRARVRRRAAARQVACPASGPCLI
jgi:hypothetical protein